MIRLDKGNVFSFSPFQSDAAKTFLQDKGYVDVESEALNTVVVVNKGQLSIKSDAVIEIIYGLGGVYRTSIVLKLVPRIFRDFLYDFVANRRLRWFGRRDTCRVPSESESDRFLE
ncbi:DCC1-like thiol-disulfide oxidoreductase family protein [Dehalococcoidia bacterium]|nr:DCC1-like thiol-disulfide oxidoreductase family protein [Dehalococcoidia bacterium]